MPRPESMLVVDDSEVERELMTLTLREAFPGADITTAEHPTVAKALCGEQAFDCVLLDYNMPETDGVTLASELRSISAYLPIVLTTSVGDEMLAAEALRSGVSDYIPKSRITAESLSRTVARSIHACGQARVIDEQRAELETFAYALAHDFKQPIRQISTFTQMISEELDPKERNGVDQHLTFLRDAARRLGKLVDVMSQYTLLNQPPKLTEVHLDKVLDEVRASLGPLLAERGAELAAAPTRARVRGNEPLMTQVLQNLVVNGLTYNKSAAPRVEVTIDQGIDHCYIAVEDNGIGIDAEYLADIFKPLVRLHTSSEYAGSGLGLTLARKAVLAQGGQIWCRSTPGAGSVFHIRAPTWRATRRRTGRGRRAG